MTSPLKLSPYTLPANQRASSVSPDQGPATGGDSFSAFLSRADAARDAARDAVTRDRARDTARETARESARETSGPLDNVPAQVSEAVQAARGAAEDVRAMDPCTTSAPTPGSADTNADTSSGGGTGGIAHDADGGTVPPDAPIDAPLLSVTGDASVVDAGPHISTTGATSVDGDDAAAVPTGLTPNTEVDAANGAADALVTEAAAAAAEPSGDTGDDAVQISVHATPSEDDAVAAPLQSRTDAAGSAAATPSAAATGNGAAAVNGIDVSGLTPVTGTASTPAASSVGPMGADAATADALATRTTLSPVAEQVGPATARLMSRGDGTHRLTLMLTPEHLGDVRITLTVRHGEVTVSFGAADEARRALLESTPELRRLLELAGATSTRVDVDEFDGTGQGWFSGADQGRGGDAGSSPGGQRAVEDLHAGTRGGIHATDGTPSGPGLHRPHEYGTSSRPTGVDLTV